MRFPSFFAIGLVFAVGTLSAVTLDAQTTARPPMPTPTRVRVTMSASSAANANANACAELAATPSALVNAPEGMALLRFKRELESAAFTLEQHQQLQGVDGQRITQVQRGVDSLMHTIIVRVQRRDGPDGGVITVLRGDSVGTLRFSAPQIQANIRTLQPQITAFIAAAEAQSGRDVNETGYMGVGLLGAQVRTVTPEGVLVSHCDYPVVETVDAGSPASRAGVLAGDTVLAYNGRDLEQRAVNYQRMLVPGETVRMRVKRGAKAREIPVAVVARSAERQIVLMFRPDETTSALATDAPRALSGQLIISSAAPATAAPAPIMGTVSTNGVAVLLGAQFSTVDDDFAQVLGLEPGILVLHVSQGSPFAEAGLRGGEIIRTFNGAAVRDVQAMRRAIVGAGAGSGSGSGARSARLSVLSRASGTRTVTLRW